MKAIIQSSLGTASLVYDFPVPKIQDDQILVKTVAVAVNPIDWMKIDGFPAIGAKQGHDYSGIVLEVGAKVTRGFQKGDRVCGYVRGGDGRNPDNGAFAEYIIAKGELQLRIPEKTSFEEASSIASGAVTAGMGLYQKLGLQRPNALKPGEGEYMLIYGGSTASAVIGIQLSALSGYKVLTTSSKRNFSFVESLGASKVFDYENPDCGSLIREYSGNQGVKIVWDTISTPSSAEICAQAISSGGQYVSLLPVKFPRTDVHASFMDATTAFGEPYEYGPDKILIPSDLEAFEFAKTWIREFEGIWEEGKVRAHAIEVGKDGLSGVLEGIERLRKKEVSAKKLVFRVMDTPEKW